jgi:hypothetical protein
MLLHIHTKGATHHLYKLYRLQGIPVKIVNYRFIRKADVASCTAIVVDSYDALNNVGFHLTNSELHEGGKASFKNLFAASILTAVRETGHVVRLLGGMTANQLYVRVNRILYIQALKKLTHAHTYQRISDPNIMYVTSDIDVLDRAEAKGKIILIATDTETKQEGILVNEDTNESYWIYNMIELVQYTFVYKLSDGSYQLDTYVIPFKKLHSYNNIKKINASPYPKATSNGHYDLEQFLHWRVPLVNWLWDVEYYLRSITSELEGHYNLNANAALWNLNITYWKDLTSHNKDRKPSQQNAFIKYSGLDTHWTAATTINQLAKATPANLKNYMLKRQFDGLTAWMNILLLPIDAKLNHELKLKAAKKYETNARIIKEATGLNPTQSEKLYPLFKKLHLIMRMLGYQDLGKLPNLQEKNLNGLLVSHPFMEAIVNALLDAKHGEKDIATFLNYIKYYKAKDIHKTTPYFDYGMSQYITLTLRYASSQSNAWCGGNIQNINYKYRAQFDAPKGKVFVSIDAPQSEARTVGYQSECMTIINVLENPELDYHIFNAANAVFKQPYDTIDKEKRTLSKPAGFGFFYGQTFAGLAKTLGVLNLRKIRKLLGYDDKTSLISVAKAISTGIDKLYWEIRGRYYPKVIAKFLKYGRVICMTGYAPVICSDINKQGTTNTIVCIDGQHTSAYINMIGGVKMLNNFLYSEGRIERSVYPTLQLHDEIQAIADENLTVQEIDDYTEDLFKNAYEVHGRIMSIPRGIPVFGLKMHQLKHDEMERTPEYLATKLKDLKEIHE